MGRNLLTSEERIHAWLNKNGYPATRVKWCITPDSGRIPDDIWNEYNGDILSLPTGKKISLQRYDSKSLIHVRLEPKIDSEGNESRSAHADLMPPELVKAKREAEELSLHLDRRKRELAEWEDNIRDRELEVRKSLMMSVQINGKLDERTSHAVDNLEKWEGHIKGMEDTSIDHIADMQEMAEKYEGLAQKNAVSASLSYTADKLISVYALSKVKKYEDLPVSMIEDFQAYMIDRAERKYFQTLPDPGIRLGESFLRLPGTDRKEFCKSIITWTISNEPSILMEAAKEAKQNEG